MLLWPTVRDFWNHYLDIVRKPMTVLILFKKINWQCLYINKNMNLNINQEC
jgi:hypothetical protein